MQRLLLLGLNHLTAPLEVREKLAFTPAQQRGALERFCEKFPSTEAVLISTCNRVEFYVARPVHGHPRVEELISFLSEFHGLSAESIRSHLYDKGELEAVEHLFSVVSSLNSMVLGETQILGQVREAYEMALSASSAGPVLNPLFQRAIAVGKQVMSETALAEGRLSVASAAVDYARGIFERFDDKTVLSIGAGKMAGLVLQHFSQLSPAKLIVCNRDVEKAAVLAGRFRGEPAPIDALGDLLVSADVVISSTGAAEPIVTRQSFEKLLRRRRYRPIFIIDIALPRDIEPSIGKLENVYLYNLDDLQKAVAQTQRDRAVAMDSAREIVRRHVDDYAAWVRTRELGPAIDRLYKRYHDLAREELDRTLSKLPNISNDERAHLEDLTRRLVNKLLHDPISTLRKSDTLHGPASQYLHALERLFNLDGHAQDTSKPQPPDSSE